jgi:spore photoproduct lyase
VIGPSDIAPPGGGEDTDRLWDFSARTLLPRLEAPTRDFVLSVAAAYRFTYQELRQVALAARDLEMWGVEPFELLWTRLESDSTRIGRERKKALLGNLQQHLLHLVRSGRDYSERGVQPQLPRRIHLEERETERQIFGRCPAFSRQAVCCGLYTLDAVRGCPFGCSYCTIQTFYGDTAELEADLAVKLEALELDPDRRYHIGTGQSSDSLIWGNRQNLLRSLLDFAARHPNVLLELKTKSDNVRYLLESELPRNVVFSWSLSTETVIRNE